MRLSISTFEDNQVYNNTKVLVTLRECIQKLKKFYDPPPHSTPFKPHKLHPHYFPYPTSFTNETGTLINFQYLKSLEDHPLCITYLAEITDSSDRDLVMGAHVVVKFITSYGKEVHRCLAQQKWALNLHHCGSFQPVPVENWTSNDFPTGRSTQSIPGLHLNPMCMVIMDYIDTLSEPPQDACLQVKEVLKYLHCNGYVFGDL